ncbi:MAG: GrpB family protein [Rhodoferax sp.]|jgi:GrpB-like predicted nucleotidyltransferase (UPF0157 family)|nr:GrpB family protein [Rhodoferax sp.]
MPMTAPVHIVDYQPAWPGLFAQEQALLTFVLAPWLVGPIAHIGSTAVPGLAAKPVIDMMAPVADLDSARPAIDALVAAGYVYHPYRGDVMHWFCKPSPEHRTHHLHVVPLGSSWWQAQIAFRDALRQNPACRDAYQTLKRRLADAHPRDREAYTQAKGPFIAGVLAVQPCIP